MSPLETTMVLLWYTIQRITSENQLTAPYGWPHLCSQLKNN